MARTGLLSSRRILPDDDLLGSFDPHTLILELHVASRTRLESSLAQSNDNQPAQVLAHELCHWTDVVGTVWGQQYLDNLFTAFDAIASSEDPLRVYPSALGLFDLDRAILFPSYYKVINPNAAPTNDRNPWAISASAGVWITPSGTLDETRPIFFVRFDESLNGPPVARQPMTLGALLELRSIAAEIATFREWLAMQPTDEQSVARTLFRRNRIAEFYEPELTTYTAAAHFLSVSIRETDFIPVCYHGAALADLCLNVAPKQFQRLRHPRAFEEFTPQRLAGFKNNQDRGYLFACLAAFAREADIRIIDKDAMAWITKQADVGSPDDIYTAAEAYLTQRLNSATGIQDEHLRTIRTELIRMGLEILRWRRDRGGYISSAVNYISSGNPTPTVITNDCETVRLTQRRMNADDNEKMHLLNIRLQELTRDALRAGRGLDFGFADYVY